MTGWKWHFKVSFYYHLLFQWGGSDHASSSSFPWISPRRSRDRWKQALQHVLGLSTPAQRDTSRVPEHLHWHSLQPLVKVILFFQSLHTAQLYSCSIMYDQEFLQMLDRTAWPPNQHQWQERPPPPLWERNHEPRSCGGPLCWWTAT